jgi:protoheme ferro-lyase
MARTKKDPATKFGVLLTLRGGPAHIENVAPFLQAVLGRQPSAEAIQDAVVRYLTIGGGSPVAFAAERIAAALERRLNGLPEAEHGGDDLRAYAIQGGDSGRAEGPVDVPVAVGCHMSAPSIADAVAGLEAAGCERIVHADLGPLESDEAIGARAEAVHSAARVEVMQAAPFVTSPAVLGFLTESATTAWGEIGTCSQRTVVFGYLEDRSREPADVPARASALIDELMEALHLPRGEAAGGSSDVTTDGGTTWVVVPIGDAVVLGNAAGDRMIAAVDAAVERGADGVTVVPVGYMVDDDATLHLIDVLAADSALSRDIEFSRAAVPNDSPIIVDALRLAVRTVL